MGVEYSSCTVGMCGREDSRNFVPGRKCGIGGNRVYQEIVDCVTYGSQKRLEALIDNATWSHSGHPGMSRKELLAVRTVKGKTLLHVACEGITFREHQRISGGARNTDITTVRVLGTEADNYMNLVHYLVENGADIHARDNKNQTPLDVIFPREVNNHKRSLGNVQICVELVQLFHVLGYPVNEQFEDGSTLLHVSCQNADFPSVSLLLDELGALINISNSNGDRPLHYCCQDDPKYRKVTQKMLLCPEIELNVRGSGKDGVSSQYLLIQAICLGHNDSACLLLDKGADPNVRYYDERTGMPLQTALFLACFQHRNKALMRANRPGGNQSSQDDVAPNNIFASGQKKKSSVCVPSLSWTPSWQLCLIDKLLRVGADPNALDVGDEKDCLGTSLLFQDHMLDKLALAKERGRTVLQRLCTAFKDKDPVASQIDEAIISMLTDAVYSTQSRSTQRANWPSSSRRLSGPVNPLAQIARIAVRDQNIARV